MNNATAITGATGEYYVAAYLSACGLVVALPRGGVPTFDLLIADHKTGKTISLQIKTARKPFNKHKDGDYYAWDISSKVKDIKDVSHWYAFVNLNNWTNSDKSPEIFFVSALDVAANFDLSNKPDAKRFFYCPYVKDAEHFKDNKGIEKMMEVLQS